jgi:hypothetical protein
MPGFNFYNLTGNTYVSGSFRTKSRKPFELSGLNFYDLTRDPYVPSWLRTNRNKSYAVRIEIPQGFPDACPRAYITNPNPLWGYKDEYTIQSKSPGSATHTLSPHSTEGWVQICLYPSGHWKASYTLFLVLIKVRLWLAAYEFHRATGKPIANFLVEAKQ